MPILRYSLFILSVLIHVLIWTFILVLPMYSKKLAKLNMIYIIPAIYIIHFLPFHIINSIKMKLLNKNMEGMEEERDKIEKYLIIPVFFRKLQKIFDDFSFANPLSPQGILILSLIISIYKTQSIIF